ncbi:hypothetical protein [Nostoc sp. DSM 114159]
MIRFWIEKGVHTINSLAHNVAEGNRTAIKRDSQTQIHCTNSCGGYGGHYAAERELG